ncbi:hypothetical protein DFP72DRAFT_753524, partial [Ephemerocybe angulata]
RDDFAFVNGLPEEVLVEIFFLHATVMRTMEDPKKRNTWIHVTHVCRHWRVVALRNPLLWTDLSFYSRLELAELSLARSGTAPLRLEYEGSSSHFLNPILMDVLSQGTRLRSLHLSNNDVLPKLLRAFQDGRILEDLSLRESRRRIVKLPKKFLLGVAPNLQCLRLIGLTIRWEDLPLPSGLTELTIHANP